MVPFRKLEKEKDKSVSEYKQQLLTQSRTLSFGKTVGDLRQLVEDLPNDLTICQVWYFELEARCLMHLKIRIL